MLFLCDIWFRINKNLWVEKFNSTRNVPSQKLNSVSGLSGCRIFDLLISIRSDLQIDISCLTVYLVAINISIQRSTKAEYAAFHIRSILSLWVQPIEISICGPTIEKGSVSVVQPYV